MKHGSLHKVVRTLKAFREKHHDQLGVSELTELNVVIAYLEQATESVGKDVNLLEIAPQAIRCIGAVLEIVTDITSRYL